MLPALTPNLNRVETSLILPFSLEKGEATVPLAGEAPALQHILIALWSRRRNIVTSRVVSWRYPGRLALFKGEASEEVIKAKVTIAEATSRPTKKISCFPAFLIHSAFGRMSATARSQVCRLEFRRRICAQYLPATGCSRGMPDSSAHNQRAFQNRDSSGA